MFDFVMVIPQLRGFRCRACGYEEAASGSPPLYCHRCGGDMVHLDSPPPGPPPLGVSVSEPIKGKERID